MAGLTWGHFNKRYNNNLKVIHEKATKEIPVDLIKPISVGKSLKFVFDKIIIKVGTGKEDVIQIAKTMSLNDFKNKFESILPPETKSAKMWVCKDSVKISTGNILKTSEFGGIDSKSSTKKGNIEWGQISLIKEEQKLSSYILNNPTASESGERDFINDFNKMICDIVKKENKLTYGIDIKIGQDVFKNIVGVNKVSGTPKSDLTLVSYKNGKLVNEVHISHKKGSRAKDFGQWSGMSSKAGTIISNDSEVLYFIEKVKKYTTDNPKWHMQTGFTIAKKIENNLLSCRATYGPNYNSNKGENNVHAILQGDPKLKKQGELYLLESSGPMKLNGPPLEGEYEPYLMAIKKGSSEKILDPNAKGVRSDFGIRGMRFSIYPKGGRKITHICDNEGDIKPNN